MVRIGLLLLCLALLLPISGVEAAGQYVAFVFEMGDSPAADLGFSQMLQHRNAKITLLLEDPKETWMEGNFEAALLFPKEWNSLTRLQVAQQLKNRQDQLPAGTKVRWLSPRSPYSDGVRQVAGAMGYCFLGPSKVGGNGPDARALTNQIRSGDVIYMGKLNASSAAVATDMMDILEKRGFQMVTVSELAGRQQIRLERGAYYNSFRRKTAK